MFSKQVIADIIKALPDTHNGLDMYLIQHDLDDKIDFLGNDTISDKRLKILRYLINNQGVKDNHGDDIVTSIIEEKVIELIEIQGFSKTKKEIYDFPNLYRNLRLDGYDIDFYKKKLIRTIPENIEMHKKEDFILETLKRYGFTTTIEHYEQSKSSYTNNNLAASNSQLRTCVESLFIDMASYIKEKEKNNEKIKDITPTKAAFAMQVLAKCGHPILEKELNEWTGQSTGYIEAFWSRLCPEGSHPGIPDIDEAIYRFQLVIINLEYLIKKFMTFNK